MSDHYKEIYLDYRGTPYTVTLEAYEQIKAIIEASRICSYCYEGYTLTNPMVVENVCLSCYLVEQKDHLPTGFRFVGELVRADNIQRSYQTYQFLDAKGYVYLLHTSGKLRDSVDANIAETLRHYGYRLPETYTLKDGKTVELQDAWGRIYGDFTTSPVILVTYKEYYGNHLATAFLLYRDREPVEFSKRKNPVRQWYLDTKAEIEATFVPHIGYIVGTGLDGEDRTSYQLYDHHLYPGIVLRARQAYDQSQSKS